MKKVAVLLSFGVFLTVSCAKKEPELLEFFKATVHGIGGDCRLLLIEFDEEVPDLIKSPIPNVYYAHNIPEEYQISGKKIEVQLGQFPKDSEFFACTTMGPTYPHIYILKVR